MTDKNHLDGMIESMEFFGDNSGQTRIGDFSGN